MGDDPQRTSVPTAVRAGSVRLCFVLAAIVSCLGVRPVTGQTCVGDCDGDAMVEITDLIRGVNIALGVADVSTCEAFANAQGRVAIAQLVKGVGNALNGCSAMTPRPTPTRTPQAGAGCAGKPDGTTCDAGTDSAHTLTCSGGTCGPCAADTSAPRFVDNGDGTITDRLTCLVWEKKDDAAGLHDKDNVYSWCLNTNGDFSCDNADAAPDGDAFTVFLAGLNSAAFAGHQDWRLPKEDGRNGSGPNELESILAMPPPCSVRNPCVAAAFNTNCRIVSMQHGNPGCTVDGAGGTQECSCTQPLTATTYWSATTTNGDPRFAWDVSFGVNGMVQHNSKTTRNFVRAVRGGL